MVERQGFEDPAYGVKRVSVTLVRKETKKEEKKNLSLLACPQMQAMVVAGLARLEGQSTGVGIMWWRGGFEDPGCGIKRVSVTLVRKGMKKHNFTYMPTNEAMVVAGLARLEG